MADKVSNSVAKPETFRSKILWVLAGCVLGVFLTQPLLSGVEIVKWRWKHPSLAENPTCNDPGWYKQLPVSGTSAQSEYDGDPDSNYYAENTTDGDRRTAWAGRFEPGSDKNVIAWNLDPSKEHVELLCIRSGYRKKLGTLAKNNRPRRVVVSACGRETVVDLEDPLEVVGEPDYRDGPDDFEAIRLDCDTSKVSIVIESVYPALDGSHQVAISDVRFLRGANFLPSSS